MECKPIRGKASIYIIMIAVLSNAFIAVLLNLVNSYLIYSILMVALILVDCYYFYYFILDLTLRYAVINNNIIISYFWKLKKVVIDLKKVKGYKYSSENIHGIKLSGIGNDKFSYGRNIIDKIGTTYMFVSSNEKALYIKAEEMCYAISASSNEEIRTLLDKNFIPDYIEDYKENNNIQLHRDKKFVIPFITISVLIVVMTLNPLILYLKDLLPAEMPLTFNTAFEPLQKGTGKQFAFKQMTYGVLNMAILFCMYYAGYFCAKYDRKTAYRYLYLTFLVVFVFLFLQVRILIKYI